MLSAHRGGAGPAAAIFLQVLIPRFIPKFDILDLPLAGHDLFLLRLAQSDCRHHNRSGDRVGSGCVDSRPWNQWDHSAAGFFVASLGVKIDVENPGTRLLINFAFTLLNIGIYLFIMHRMLALNVRTNWLHEVIKAVINSIVGLLLRDPGPGPAADREICTESIAGTSQ